MELAFLARAKNTESGRITSSELLLGDESSDAVFASGHGGLRLRGFATVGQDRLELNPAIEGLVGVLATANQWIQLSSFSEVGASSVLMLRGRHLAVIPRALDDAGVVDVAALDMPATARRSLRI